MPPSRAMVKIMNELAYLRQEVEFIKKLRKRRTERAREVIIGNPASVFQLIHDTLLQKENLLTVSELCK